MSTEISPNDVKDRWQAQDYAIQEAERIYQGKPSANIRKPTYVAGFIAGYLLGADPWLDESPDTTADELAECLRENIKKFNNSVDNRGWERSISALAKYDAEKKHAI